MIRLIAIDVDGTLLDGHHQVRPGVVREAGLEASLFDVENWTATGLTLEVQEEAAIVELVPDVSSDPLGSMPHPHKILVIAPEKAPSSALARVAEAARNSTAPTYSKPNYLEILPIGVSKAVALHKLAVRLGLDPAQIATIGDGHNDIEMLQGFGLGVAMGNASAEVKEVAAWVTASSEEEGVASALARMEVENFFAT